MATCEIETEFECLVNRYYDPATDQFISVDPLAAVTGQPYAFTGDDPLNARDPLGLLTANRALNNYKKAVSNKCHGHPNRNGCRGINVEHNLVSALDNIRHIEASNGSNVVHHPVAVAEVTAGTALLATGVGDAPGAALDSAGAADLGINLGGLSEAVNPLRFLAAVGLVGVDTVPCIHGDASACFSSGAGILALENPLVEAVALPIAITKAILDLAGS